MIKTPVLKTNKRNVSIALCTYNGSDYIIEQLSSIKEQTLVPYEVVIVDDCSTDNTLEEISKFQKYSPFSISVSKNSHRLGPAKNFERAISLCTGELIALCDQDDIWDSRKLEKSVHALAEQVQSNFAFPALLHTASKLLFNDGSIEANPCRYRNEKVPGMSRLLKRLLMQNTVTGCTTLITNGLKEVALPFPDEIIMHDWWLALNAATHGKVFYLNEPTVLYRRHGNTFTSPKKNSNTSFSLKKEIRGITSLLKCIRGHSVFVAELSQASTLFKQNKNENNLVNEIRKQFDESEKHRIFEACHFVNDNDIFWANKYEKAKAMIAVWRYSHKDAGCNFEKDR